METIKAINLLTKAMKQWNTIHNTNYLMKDVDSIVFTTDEKNKKYYTITIYQKDFNIWDYEDIKTVNTWAKRYFKKYGYITWNPILNRTTYVINFVA